MNSVPSKPIRIVRVINALWTGGVQTRLLTLLPKLAERGAHCEIIVIRKKGGLAPRFRDVGVPVHKIVLRSRLRPASIAKLAHFYRERRYDVVHSHMYKSNAPATVAACVARVPCIVAQVHNVDEHYRGSQRRTDRILTPLRDKTLCVSDAVRDYCAEALRLSPNRFETLLNGIDAEPPSGLPSRADVLKGLGLPGDALLVSHVARLHPQKNHAAVLQEIPRILKAAPQVHFLIIGEGGLEKDLQRKAEELGVADNVHLLGLRDDVPALLEATDISILPSRKEGFSNAILESMVHRAALVVTDVGGAREQLRDGVDGFILPLEEMTAFGDRIIDLALDPELRERMTASASERVQMFSLDAMADQTMNIYEEVLRRKNRWP